MKYTKEQAIELVGIEIVEKVESINCDPTGRLIYPAFEPEHAEMEEFSAYYNFDGGSIEAYYYQSKNDLKEYSDDISMLVWEAEYYEIEMNI